jgi:hypothetical protein
VAAGRQDSGAISYVRGHIKILDQKLEWTICECYRVVKDELDRLLGYGFILPSGDASSWKFGRSAITFLAVRSRTIPIRVSSDPIAAYPELPYHRAEGAKEEKQTQSSEKHGEDHNEI